MEDRRKPQPPQAQDRQPGREGAMTPPPRSEARDYRPASKLVGQAAVVTGGDSGIGRAVAVAFAKEGADVAFGYLEEHEDAAETRRLIEEQGRRCLSIAGDIGDPEICRRLVEDAVAAFGRLDVLVNNAGEQHTVAGLEELSDAQLERTFRTNVFSMFYLTRAALGHMREGGRIVNTTSVTAYRGSGHLLDYASSKAAIVGFTRSMARNLAGRGIRVNAVAPGPVWTPLIPASFEADHVAEFGAETIQGRPAAPDEIAPSFVFLATGDSEPMTGQVLHPNGGEIVGS